MGRPSIAEKIGGTAETLRKWVRRAERDSGRRPGLTSRDRQKVKEPERVVREPSSTRAEGSTESTQSARYCRFAPSTYSERKL